MIEKVVRFVHLLLSGFEDVVLLVNEGLFVRQSIDKVYGKWGNCLNCLEILDFHLVAKPCLLVGDLIHQ